MLKPIRTNQFKRDVEWAKSRGKDMTKLRTLILFLLEQKPLPIQYKDHSLKGQWLGFRDAHIEPDWLLIYQIVGQELRLTRTGTHTDLFK